MSSRVIAEKTGKQHKNVIRDIEKILGELELGRLKFEHSYTTAQNKQAKEYLLPERELHILMTGYSIPLRAALIDEWTQMKAQLKEQKQAELPLPVPTQKETPQSISEIFASMGGIALCFSPVQINYPTPKEGMLNFAGSRREPPARTRDCKMKKEHTSEPKRSIRESQQETKEHNPTAIRKDDISAEKLT